jgi:hypothetical protein
VRITWVSPLHNGGAAIDRYAVQRAAAATGPWNTVASPSSTSFAWKNSGLVNGTRYYYRVRAHNSAGLGTPSAVVSAVPRTVPSAPLSPAAVSEDGSAMVSWSAPSSNGGATINSYRLQFSLDDTTWSSVTGDAQTQLTAGGLENGEQYHFRVLAHNAAGWGPASVEVLTTPGLPLPPGEIHAASYQNGVDISWTESPTVSPPVTMYDVQISTDDVNWSRLTTFPPTTFEYKDKYTSLGQTYYLRIRAYTAFGPSDWTGPASAVAGLAPSAVGNLTITYYGSPFFWNSVSWTAPTSGSDLEGYYIDRIVTEGPYVRVATNDGAHPSYLDQGVSHTTDYWYRVTPFNAVGNGPSSEVHITTP